MTDSFRVLANDEIDAVSGGVCVTEADVYNIRGKGEFESALPNATACPASRSPTPNGPRPSRAVHADAKTADAMNVRCLGAPW